MFINRKKNKEIQNVPMRIYGKTKIVCTLGPATSTEEIIIKMCESGMDIARLNFSHGSHKEQLSLIKKIRNAAKIVGEPIAIMQDLQGPKIRTGLLENKTVELKAGNKFVLTPSGSLDGVGAICTMNNCLRLGCISESIF